MATNTATAPVTNLTAAQLVPMGRGIQSSAVMINKFSANAADKTAIGTFVGTINNVIAVMELGWNDVIHNITFAGDALDTNGTPTLTLDVGVGHINRILGISSLVVDSATVYGSALTTGQAAVAYPGACIMTSRDVTQVGSGSGNVFGSGATVLNDSGLTVIPEGSIPVLILKAHAAAATAASAPKVAIKVDFTR